MTRKTVREQEAEEAFFRGIFGIFHHCLIKTGIVPGIYIYLVLVYGFTDVVKLAIALPMFFYILFLFAYITMNKNEKDRIWDDAKGLISFIVGIILAILFVYFVIGI
tara:strand:- start:316 stop:636 length:321 start_codon:yes stop_codon:yes gene_type:complete